MPSSARAAAYGLTSYHMVTLCYCPITLFRVHQFGLMRHTKGMSSLIDRRARQPSLGGWPDYAAAAISMLLLWVTILGFLGLPRVLLAAAFTFVVPGRAIVINWPQIARWSAFGMSMVLSLAVLTVIATVALWAHAWHPMGILQVEAGLSAALIIAGLARRSEGVSKSASDQLGLRRDVPRR